MPVAKKLAAGILLCGHHLMTYLEGGEESTVRQRRRTIKHP
jgi:hypothetical protein